jgi:hypothetical protein
MPADEDFENALRRIEEYIQRTGDTVQANIDTTTEGEIRVQGYLCSHGSHTFQVLGTRDWEHFVVRYPLRVDQLLAIRQKSQQPTGEELRITQEEIQAGRERLDEALSQKDRGELRELRLNLIQLLAEGSCIVNLDTTAQLQIHGFDLDKQIYVYEDRFELSDFHEAVQRVINLGWIGRDLLLEGYGFTESISAESGASPSPGDTGSRGFQ